MFERVRRSGGWADEADRWLGERWNWSGGSRVAIADEGLGAAAAGFQVSQRGGQEDSRGFGDAQV